MSKSPAIIDRPLVFVDVETTGVSAVRGRVIEVAAIRVENGREVGRVSTLINPDTYIPRNITAITGITDGDVVDAPRFRDIADELLALLDGAVFVAHNVRFDYGFLKQEFMRVGHKFQPQMLCTVRLSRALYPQMARHRLADVIRYHGYTVDARHRAYDDANVLVQLWQTILAQHGPDALETAARRQIARPAIPRHLDADAINALPQSPGVYVFRGDDNYPIYIGKSVRIRDRVLSHFTNDSRDSKEFKIAQSIRSIDTHLTSGELSALLLESHMIKQYMPLHNRRLRRTRKLSLVIRHLDDSGYYRLERIEANPESLPDIDDVVGVYARRSGAKAAIEQAVDVYDLCPRMCGLESGTGACFRYQLGKCRGACVGQESPDVYNQRVMTVFEDRGVAPWPHDGPVVMYEYGHGRQSALLVDRWVIREMLHYDGDDQIAVPVEAVFDYDSYVILSSYLRRYPDRITIRPHSD